ncbi:homing endonuclease [Vibrio phage D69]
MDYKRIHNEIVSSAKNRGWTKQASEGNYIETHHIIPKSMGGDDSPENLVTLTGREHFLIHWLLYKIHRNRSMAFAWNSMSAGNSRSKRYTSKSFEYARRSLREVPVSVETRQKMSKSRTGSKRSRETRDRMSKAYSGINNVHWKGYIYVEGYTYDTIRDAAKSIGVSKSTVHNRVSNPKFTEYKRVEENTNPLKSEENQ